MDPMLVGVLAFVVLFFLLLVVGLPIGAGMAIVGTVGFWYLVSGPATFSKIAVIPFDTITSYVLAMIPLFVLMATVISYSGFGQSLYEAASKWLGRLPGGLAVATVGGCAVFGAIDTGGMLAMSVMSLMAYPEMKRYKYDDRLATGCIAAATGLGALIPPSGVLIIFGMMTGASVGKLFIAGIIPGILLAAIYMLVILVWSWKNPKIGPRGPSSTFREKIASLGSCGEIVMLITLVLGGIILGWFTPTEAGAIGAFGAILFGFIRRRLNWTILKQCFVEVFKLVGMMYLLMIGALIFAAFMPVTELPFRLSAFISSLQLPPLAIMALIIIIYLLLGCIMDVMAMVVLTLPIFYPLALALGFSPIWFGIIIVLITLTAGITPPVAMSVWVVKILIKDVPIGTIYKGIVPFFIGNLVIIVLLLFFPGIATFLPELMR